MAKVGIPRGLLYHRYGRFWASYLSGLGFEVLVSPRTTKKTIELGLGKVSSEVCLPLKILAGHVEELKHSVDYLLVPRLVWAGDRLYACPKMIGAPDLARLTVPRGCRVLAPEIRGDFVMPLLRLGFARTGNPFRVRQAYVQARSELPRRRELPVFADGATKVALISHFYNLDDEYVAQDIVGTLRTAGVRLYTKEDLPDRVLRSGEGLARSVRWVYERELYNAFRFYAGRVDGICAVVSFGCGPDSLVVDLMQREAKERHLPFTQLMIDEHTGTAGVVTRIEAFLDTVVRRGRGNRSAVS